MRRTTFAGVHSCASASGSPRGRVFYFVWQLADGSYAVQKLTAALQPDGGLEHVSAGDFSKRFQREMAIAATPPPNPDTASLEAAFLSRKRQSARDASEAGAHRAFSLEASRRAKVVEAKMRETFRQTLLRLKRPRDSKAAKLALEQLAGATEGVVPAHKHMFRDFGVRLRQNFQPALALLFSRRTVELSPQDDHARFNLARILCVLGQYDEAASQIRSAISMAGDEGPLYQRMLAHILALQRDHAAAAQPRPRGQQAARP